MTTLAYTHLVQRMKPARPYNQGEGLKAHHVFGGPMGLSSDGWKILDQVCTLEYMGAAEYEAWGGPGPTPQSLSRMAEWSKLGQLRSFAFVIGPHQRALNWSRGYAKKDQVLPPAKFVVIYGLCHESMLEAVEERIRVLAKNERAFHIKSGLRLTDSLDPLNKGDYDRTCGWLELDNHFLFVSDKTMWEGFCKIFEIEKCEAPEPPTMIDFSKMRKPQLVEAAMGLGMFAYKADARRIEKKELAKILIEAQEKAHASLLP